MAAYNPATSDAEVRKVWSMRAYEDGISDETVTGQAKKWGCLVVQDDLSKGAGDNVKFHLRRRLATKGLRGMQAATGNEQSLVYDQDSVTIDQLREVVQVPNKGTIAAQRVTFDLPEDAYAVLRNWHIERQAVAMFNQAAGYYPTSLVYDGVTVTGDDRLNYTGLTPALVPSSNNIVRAGTSNTTDQAVNADTTATLRFSHFDTCVARAQKNRPYIERIGMGGIEYVAFVHVDGFVQLINDTTAPIQYRDIMLAKIASGAKNEELIGQTMQYHNTLIISTDKIPYGVHGSTSAAQTNVRRAVFMGREALGMAMGRGYSTGKETVAGYTFEQDMVDVNEWKRIALKCVYAIKKIVYNSVDRGVIVISHYVA